MTKRIKLPGERCGHVLNEQRTRWVPCRLVLESELREIVERLALLEDATWKQERHECEEANLALMVRRLCADHPNKLLVRSAKQMLSWSPAMKKIIRLEKQKAAMQPKPAKKRKKR